MYKEGRKYGLECLTCKKHWSHGGRCSENVSNCLHYEEEPRGKMVRTELTFHMDTEAETPVIKFGEKILVSDGSKAVEMSVIKINWVNLQDMLCNVTAEYHENEMPRFEKTKKFKVVNGK